MDVSSIQNLYKATPSATTSLTTDAASKTTNGDSFDSVLNLVMGMVGETNDLQNSAESEQIKFALGESDNTHDLAVAQQKANIALQYTVAVRDRFISGYQEIMNMQI